MGDIRWSEAGGGVTWRKSGLMIMALCLTAALAACGGDEEEAATAQGPPGGPPANAQPTITGTPATQVLQGQQYSFTPTASDPNGDALAFTITNTPAWATFNASTGQLRGTPTAGQVGTYSNIRISVSDGTTTVNLAAFNVSVVAAATGSATLTWNPPTQNADGSPLSDLAGYRVYWGPSQGNYTSSASISNPGLSSYVVEQLTPATWFFAMTSVNSAGAESSYSNVASKQVL